MKFTTKNLLNLTKPAIKDAPKQAKTYGYQLTVEGKTLNFKKYSEALNGYIVAVRNNYSANIRAIRI